MTRVLVVDDEAVIRNLFIRVLGLKGYQVTVASDGHEAVVKVKQDGYKIAFVDTEMPGLDGAETLEEIKKLAPETITVMLSSGSDPEEHRIERKAVESGAYGCLYKPFEVSDILKAVDYFS